MCAEVDISRRTFFNYFPSKEDAILGAHPEEELKRFTVDFLDRGSHGWGAVVDDLVDLVIEHFEGVDVDAIAHAEFRAALEREPRLLLRFMGVSRERDRQAVELVAAREGVTSADPRAHAAVNILSTLIKSAGERYLDPANTHDISSLIHTDLAALRDVIATSDPRKATQ